MTWVWRGYGGAETQDVLCDGWSPDVGAGTGGKFPYLASEWSIVTPGHDGATGAALCVQPWGHYDWGTASAIGSGTPGTLTDSTKHWVADYPAGWWTGAIVFCGEDSIYVATYTDTVLTGTDEWHKDIADHGVFPAPGPYTIAKAGALSFHQYSNPLVTTHLTAGVFDSIVVTEGYFKYAWAPGIASAILGDKSYASSSPQVQVGTDGRVRLCRAGTYPRSLSDWSVGVLAVGAWHHLVWVIDPLTLGPNHVLQTIIIDGVFQFCVDTGTAEDQQLGNPFAICVLNDSGSPLYMDDVCGAYSLSAADAPHLAQIPIGKAVAQHPIAEGAHTGTANAAVTTGADSLTDTRTTWAVNCWVGAVVTCDGKTITVVSNTATVLTGTANWSPSQPANGLAYAIAGPSGWVKGSGGAGSYTEWRDATGNDGDTTYNKATTSGQYQGSLMETAATLGISAGTILASPVWTGIHRNVSGGSKWQGHNLCNLSTAVTITAPGTSYVPTHIQMARVSGAWAIGDLDVVVVGAETQSVHNYEWRVTLVQVQGLVSLTSLPLMPPPMIPQACVI